MIPDIDADNFFSDDRCPRCGVLSDARPLTLGGAKSVLSTPR